jgi:hypothetical protein
MPPLIVPESFARLLTAFRGCFGAPSYRTFCLVVTGWVHCLGRHTVTAVALAAGAVGSRHVSVFHRFFARAAWAPDALGRVLFALALPWVPADQPLYVLVDDTLARKAGKAIALASMHHDPLLSTKRKPFFSFGHVWVVLALWVPLPVGSARGLALPLLFRLYTGTRRGQQADAPSRPTSGPRYRAARTLPPAGARATKLELARDLVALVAAWAGDRPVYVAADAQYAGRTLLAGRPANVHVLSRLRPDAALWAPPPPRRPGQRGRPRRRGERRPSPQALAARRRHWHALPVRIYGRTVVTHVFRGTALWYAALPTQPVRFVVVRDPAGRRQDEAFFCTDLTAGAAFLLEGYARRWCLEVTFHDAKQALGLADSPAQAPQAVRRTAPLAGLVYSLIVLWYTDQTRTAGRPLWLVRPWYRHKTTPSFADMLAALRQEAWSRYVSAPPRRRQRPQKDAPPWFHAVLATA